MLEWSDGKEVRVGECKHGGNRFQCVVLNLTIDNMLSTSGISALDSSVFVKFIFYTCRLIMKGKYCYVYIRTTKFDSNNISAAMHER